MIFYLSSYALRQAPKANHTKKTTPKGWFFIVCPLPVGEQNKG